MQEPSKGGGGVCLNELNEGALRSVTQVLAKWQCYPDSKE